MGKLVNNLVNYFQGDLSARMYFVSKTKEGYEIFSRFLEDKVVESFKMDYRKFLHKRTDYPEVKYGDTVEFEPKTVYYLNSNALSQISELLRTHENQDLDFDTKIHFVFIKFQNPALQELIVFKAYRPSKFLNTKKRALLVITNKALKFSDVDALVVDDSIDCVLFEDKIVVLHVKNFEDIYDLTEYYKGYSNEVFEYLSSKTDYTIVNLEELQKTGEGSLPSLRRMYILSSLGVYSILDLKGITTFNKDKTFGLTIEGKNIKFPNFNKFYDLYQDVDEFVSDLTNIRYKSISKQRIN